MTFLRVVYYSIFWVDFIIFIFFWVLHMSFVGVEMDLFLDKVVLGIQLISNAGALFLDLEVINNIVDISSTIFSTLYVDSAVILLCHL